MAKIDGMGGAGNGTGMGPFVIAYACIVHNPTADADDRYPNASLWSTTLPVDGLIFANDVNKNGLHLRMLPLLLPQLRTVIPRPRTTKSKGLRSS